MGFLTDLSPINKFLFFPPQPASYSLESFRGELCNLNGVLCLALSAVTPSSNVILYAHGNASDIGQCRRYLVRLRDRLGMHILAVEYPGYGVAGGAPSEATVDRALQAVFDYVTQALRWPKRCVLVMGRSIGTGPAVKLAAREPECAGLVLLAAFTSIKAVAEQMLGKAAMVMVDRWRSVDNIAQVRCPVLLIHGSADQTIPAQHSLELYQAVRHARRDIQIFENLDHNQYNWKTIIRRLEEFFQQFDVRDPSIPHRLLALPREVFEEWGDHGKGCAPPDMWSPFRAVFYGASAASAAGGGLAPKGQQVRHPIIAAQERGGSSGLGDVGAVGLVQQGGGGGGGGAASGSTPSASPRPSFSSFASPPPGGAVSPFALQALTPQPDADYEKIMRGDTSVLGAAAAAAADEGRAPEPPPLFTLPRPPRRAGHPLSTGGTPPLSGGGGTPAAAAAAGGGLPPRHHHQRGAQSLDLTPITITSWLSPARRDNQRPPSRGKAVTSCSPQHRQRKEYWRRERTRSWNRVDRPEEYDETKHEEEEFDEEAVLESEHRFRSRVAEVLPLPPRRPPSRVRRPERPGSAARAAAAAAGAGGPRGPGGGGGGPGGERRAHSTGPGGAGRRREVQGAREAALATHQRSQSAALSPRAQREALQGQRRIPALFRRRRRRGSDASSTSGGGGGGGGREEARSPSWGRRGRRKADRSGSRGRAAVDVPAARSRAPSPVPGYTPTAAELRLQAALAAAAAAPPPPPAASPSPHLLVATAAHTPQRPLREGGRGAAAGVGAGRGGGSLSPAPPHQLTVPYSPVPFMGAPGVAT